LVVPLIAGNSLDVGEGLDNFAEGGLGGLELELEGLQRVKLGLGWFAVVEDNVAVKVCDAFPAQIRRPANAGVHVAEPCNRRR
jgi:hypothetical protein